LTADEVEQIHQNVAANEGYQLTVDLENNLVTDGNGFSASFEIDEFRRSCFLEGLDHIALTMQHLDKIEAYENEHGVLNR